jgi:hypothetical protein
VLSDQGPTRSLSMLAALMCAVALPGPFPASAQEPRRPREPVSFVNQQRQTQERLRERLDAEPARSLRDVSFDYGGWYSLHLFIFDDGVESSRTLRRHDLRLWSRLELDQGLHEFYARGLLSFLDFNTGDSYDGDDDDVEGMNLERGYYRLNLSRAWEASGGSALEGDVILQAGRDLVEFGGGLSLALTLDHVLLETDYRDFQVTGLAGRTVGSRDDFDLSLPASRTRRAFFGAELRYLGFGFHEPFAYVLWQRDHNTERPVVLFQEFDYDSFYVGLGSVGEIVKGLNYEAEAAYEVGHSFSDRQFLEKNRVEAWALHGQLEYLFPGPHKARTSAEYLFGSGDPDRLFSPINSAGGNIGDFRDTSFIGFGWFDTGLAFAPLYSNLHMVRAGASIFPWPASRRLGHLELGTDLYLYHKHHRSGAVSDPTANVQSGYLGWEMDCYANWQVAYDLFWTARLGVFFPGQAFSDRTTRTFLLLGMTWSF